MCASVWESLCAWDEDDPGYLLRRETGAGDCLLSSDAQ